MQSLRQSEKAVKYTFIVGRDMKIIATVNTKLATALFKSKFTNPVCPECSAQLHRVKHAPATLYRGRGQ